MRPQDRQLMFDGDLDELRRAAIAVLRQYCPPDGYYLAFSGGKDSQTLYRLAELAGVPFDAHYSVTTIDPPELVRFIRQSYPLVAFDRPKQSLVALVAAKRIPPTRRMRYCCEVLKERGGEGRIVLTGVRSAESPRRRWRPMIREDPGQGRLLVINPLIDWPTPAVWSFLREQQIAYCHLYDEGLDRLGCMACPMGGSKRQVDAFRRWPQAKALWLLAFDRMLAARRAKNLHSSWDTALDVMRWWLALPDLDREEPTGCL